MAGFLYFVEAADKNAPPDAEALGLGYALGERPERRYVPSFRLSGGEAAVSGFLLWRPEPRELSDEEREALREATPDQKAAPAPPPPVRMFQPESQKWRPMPPVAGVRRWVGMEVDSPPTPESLSRNRGLDFFVFEDAAGREWMVPRVAAVDEAASKSCALPRSLDLSDDGSRVVAGDVVADYAALWRNAERWWANLVSDQMYDAAEAYGDAAECLAALYRVSKYELALLGVFSEAPFKTAGHVVAIALSYYRWLAITEAKKADPFAGSPTPSGSPTAAGGAA